jgi:hypothetical protein
VEFDRHVGHRCAVRDEPGGDRPDVVARAQSDRSLPADIPGYTEDSAVYVAAIHALIRALDRTPPEAHPKPRPAKKRATTPKGK